MKKILLTLCFLIGMISYAQVQTFSRAPKFLNVSQNNSNTKILSLNTSTNVLQWVDKSTISSSGTVPTLQQVLTSGRTWSYTHSSILQNGISFDPLDVGMNSLFYRYTTGFIGSYINYNYNEIQLYRENTLNNIDSRVHIKNQDVVISQTNFGVYDGIRVQGGSGIIFEKGGTNDGSQVNLKSDNITGNRNLQFTDASGRICTLSTTPPATSTSSGVVGELRVDSSYVYFCVAPNQWVRAALSTW